MLNLFYIVVKPLRTTIISINISITLKLLVKILISVQGNVQKIIHLIICSKKRGSHLKNISL